jgi:Cation efflux family
MAYRRVLWAVLGINATMFLIEVGAGFAAGSASLQADALDFFGDAANYAISLLVVGMVLRYRAMGRRSPKASPWVYSAYGLSEPRCGMRSLARCRMRSL